MWNGPPVWRKPRPRFDIEWECVGEREALHRLRTGFRIHEPMHAAECRLPEWVEQLPPHFSATRLDVSQCTRLRLPATITVEKLIVGAHPSPERLLEGVSCRELDLRGSTIQHLPPSVIVCDWLRLDGCSCLEELPEGLIVKKIDLTNCIRLRALPPGIQVEELDVSGCTALTGWPGGRWEHTRKVIARGCSSLQSMPPVVGNGWRREVDVSDCPGIRSLDGLARDYFMSVQYMDRTTIDIAGTGVTAVPDWLSKVALRWRGVEVDEQTAFRPHTLSTSQVLRERNVERRRVMMERMGYDRFLEDGGARELDRDRDTGGERRLMHLGVPGEWEPLVCVFVRCPSTSRRYALRVPPNIRTCRQAVAWVAGFDNPDDYQPLAET